MFEVWKVIENFQSMAMGFGFGAVAGAILSDFLGLPFFETTFFFLGGIAGATLASGYFGEVIDITDIFS